MDLDVIVIGGGAAGLSGAITLARARRRVLVLDSDEPRNAPADGVHSFLSREGTAPRELLAMGAAEFAGYGGLLRRTHVVGARPVENGFEVTEADGTCTSARRLLVTTGLVDELPDIPGLREQWGRAVLHCPYCHGWEIRDQPVAVVACGPMAAHQAKLFRQWTPHLTVFRNGQPMSAGDERALAVLDVPVIDATVVAVESDGDRLIGVRTADGALHECAAIAVQPRFVARSDVLAGLGLDAVSFEVDGVPIGSYVPADVTGRTAVPGGVWVAGNVADPQAQVITAAAAGVKAAGMINMDLIDEDIERALDRLPT